MTNSDLVAQLMIFFGEYVAYMLPVIGLFAGFRFIMSWFSHILFFDLFRKRID